MYLSWTRAWNGRKQDMAGLASVYCSASMSFVLVARWKLGIACNKKSVMRYENQAIDSIFCVRCECHITTDQGWWMTFVTHVWCANNFRRTCAWNLALLRRMRQDLPYVVWLKETSSHDIVSSHCTAQPPPLSVETFYIRWTAPNFAERGSASTGDNSDEVRAPMITIQG